MRRVSHLCLVGIFISALLGAGPAFAQQGPTRDYRIGPKDLLDIHVSPLSDLNGSQTVDANGDIALPLIGEFPVGGLTASEASARLKALLESKYVQHATVDIQVKKFLSQPISLIGAVNTPGPLDFSGRWTLLQAITAAGGLAANHGNTIYILRQSQDGLSDQLAVSVNDLMLKADPTVNIPIYANDLINVPASVTVTVYCLGQVGSPGAVTFQSTERITLLSAIARAGGLTDRASHKITIKRANPEGGPANIIADYGRIVSGEAPDIPLYQGDVVIVKESFF